MRYIVYKDGYKYQLSKGYIHSLGIDFPEIELHPFIRIAAQTLIISQGYAWDGASGPAIDTKNILRGSLVHDALYQLIREGKLHPSFKSAADLELYRTIRADGMTWLRAKFVLLGVAIFGAAALVNDENLDQIAPSP